MCGKFTAKRGWRNKTDLADIARIGEDPTGVVYDGPDGMRDDDSVGYRVMEPLPLIVWHRDEKRRRVIAARWGFPHPDDWRRPQPIHARAETIDTTHAFADAFCNGQRGIALVDTFNEAPDIDGPTIQHTITPETPAGIAFIWRSFNIGAAAPLIAAVMVTVSANKLIGALPTDRMPAVLAPEDWAVWLGEEPASAARIKACLKTVEGVNWRMERERKRRKPTVSDPPGLF